ncbi:Gfo/Idh/MocA family protein [Pseudoruegeria sp. SK021]|uniref:Gfo/Idh/MocA family protein n=1 Tax=Pseudoruegeria sp. SK021 TaxID=1933035 RepID=UPI000A22D353|nr:Gfo/Idh/MocA family oxidoreductase [Pseudoruegeria sp. SK021]OSP54706.1 oxidoreductase [Pseudoruegeria sp. SK021]
MRWSVAIVGAGIGAEHLAGYRSHPARFRVRCICDRDEARGRALAATVPGLDWVGDMDAVLRDPAIDLVDICLPPHLHFAATMAALAAGKHVICEKPIVTSLAEADAVKAKSAETGRTVFGVFQYRYGLGTAQLHALIAAGLTGKPLVGTLETHWNRSAAYYDIPWRGTWAGEQGGAILGHAIHSHDLLTSVFGPVASVHAELATRVNTIEVEDCAALALRMTSGALVTSSVTLGAAEDTSRLRLVYDRLTVESDHAPYQPAAKAWTFTARAPGTQAAIDAVLAQVGPQEIGFSGLFQALADALDGDTTALNGPVTLQDGRNAIELVTAAYASSRSGVPVQLPLTGDHPLYGGWMP